MIPGRQRSARIEEPGGAPQACMAQNHGFTGQDGEAASSALESTFALIERVRQGDRQALEELVARHIGPLRRWVTGRLPRWARDMADTDDLVQDTLLKTLTRFEKF